MSQAAGPRRTDRIVGRLALTAPGMIVTVLLGAASAWTMLGLPN